jgi:hypothetical protein
VNETKRQIILKALKTTIMKNLLNSLFTQLSNGQVKNQASETREPGSYGFSHQNCPIFTSADLWNIQRQGKSRPQRRFI